MILSKFWQNQDAGRALASKTLGEDTSLPPSASGWSLHSLAQGSSNSSSALLHLHIASYPASKYFKILIEHKSGRDTIQSIICLTRT